MNFQKLEQLLCMLTQDMIIPALSVAIGRDGDVVYHHSSGVISETGEQVSSIHRFDIASLTKTLIGVCFMMLVEEKLIDLQDPIYKMFPEFDSLYPVIREGKIVGKCNARDVTWFHALTHTTGISTQYNMKKEAADLTVEDVLDVAYHPCFMWEPGQHVLYSDIPFILIGLAMEKVTGQPLDRLLCERITDPLAMKHTSFLRRSTAIGNTSVLAVPTEYDQMFRKKRIWGEVHDMKAYLLDGVAGHAGVFATAEDMCRFAMAYNACAQNDGLIKTSTYNAMVQQYYEEGFERRGLMWELSFHGKGAYTDRLSMHAYGHSGFTGCLLWIEPALDMSFVFLSNDVYNGRNNRRLAEYREEIINCTLQGVDA